MSSGQKEGDRAGYDRIIEAVFQEHYRPGSGSFEFDREELAKKADEIGISRPANLGDVIYSFRYRRTLPSSILSTAPDGMEWTIKGAGRGKYEFALVREDLANITPNGLLTETKIPDATPGLIRRYALTDEQALLAILRYNRLIDIFTGVTCYSLQSHLRTTVADIGQVETDELYIGVDRSGAHYVFPVQAKGGTDTLSIVQIEQDLHICREKFPDLIAKPIATQFMSDEVIALFQFEGTDEGMGLDSERHFQLVPPEELTSEDLALYRDRLRGTAP